MVRLADAIARGLRRGTFAVDVAEDGQEALDKMSVVEYDLVVLDRNLPVVHGDVVCERMASDGAAARILMLTASADVDQRVEGPMLGADDYLPKPFVMAELVARLRALGRRVNRAVPVLLRWKADIVMDPGRRQSARGDRALKRMRGMMFCR